MSSDGMTLEEIGKTLGISGQAVSKIIMGALSKMKRRLSRRGITSFDDTFIESHVIPALRSGAMPKDE